MKLIIDDSPTTIRSPIRTREIEVSAEAEFTFYSAGSAAKDPNPKLTIKKPSGETETIELQKIFVITVKP